MTATVAGSPLGDVYRKRYEEPADDSVRPLTQYQQDPVGFFVKVLEIPEHTIRWSKNEGYAEHTWDGTPDPIVAMLEGLRDSEDVSVESATGTGKSFTAAGVVLWFLASWKDSRVFTFAPKEDQLRQFMWKEIRQLWPKFQAHFPSATLTDLSIRMKGGIDDTWAARGYAVGVKQGEQTSTKAQGMHAEHMLLVYEETPGIPLPVLEAGENTATGPHNLRLAVGNPDHQLDALHLFGHDQFGKVREGVRAIRISALDHPNLVSENDDIVPGAASRKSERRRFRKYGEEGRLYKSRIRGLSPAESQEALIKLEWVQAAQKRWFDQSQRGILMYGQRALGVDVANSEDGDEAAISRWKGAFCFVVDSFPCPNANDLGYRVHLEMKEDGILDEHVGVDSVGVGAGAVNELKRNERYIKALGGGDSPVERFVEDEEYGNLRCQMWWTMREDLRQGLIALPPDVQLATDLITPQWKTSNGKIIVEAKETLMKRLPGGRSPNKGDAAVYGNWVRDRTDVLADIPPKNMTRLQRLAKEFEELDRQEREHDEADEDADRFGGAPLRQG